MSRFHTVVLANKNVLSPFLGSMIPPSLPGWRPAAVAVCHVAYENVEFTVNSLGSFITANVPSGATSGTIQVVTPIGTLSSNVPFQVK
jgi:hypothetical protein